MALCVLSLCSVGKTSWLGRKLLKSSMDIKIANGEGMYMSLRNEKGWPGEDRVRGIAV